MHNLLTSKYFLIISALFLVAAIAVIWFFFPPVIKSFNDNREQADTLAAQIETSQAEAATVNDLIAAKATIAELHEQASTALPGSPSADLLLLQLDGLTKSLGLEATITVPFSQATLPAQVDSSAAPKNESDIRWNAVTSIDLTRAADKSTATISGKVFWVPSTNLQFSGTAKDLLSQAKTLFDGYQTYAEAPDVTKEGNFGKSNPFAP